MSSRIGQLVAIAKSNQSWRQKAKNCCNWGTGAIYGALEHPTVHKWAIPLHGSWLAAGKWVKVFHYINQLQFSIVRKTALSYYLLYFCLPAGRFTEVCVIVIQQLLTSLNKEFKKKFFFYINSAIILAFSLSLVLHRVLLVSQSTMPHT